MEREKGEIKREKNEIERVCSKCGSNKVIPDVQIMDRAKRTVEDLLLCVPGDPDVNWVERNQYGAITADVCCQCGYLELYTDNLGGLWDNWQKYLESAEQTNTPEEENSAEDVGDFCYFCGEKLTAKVQECPNCNKKLEWESE